MAEIALTFLYPLASQEGSTCVHIAAMKGSVSVMKELLKFNPSGITTARNKVKQSSRCQAVRCQIQRTLPSCFSAIT